MTEEISTVPEIPGRGKWTEGPEPNTFYSDDKAFDIWVHANAGTDVTDVVVWLREVLNGTGDTLNDPPDLEGWNRGWEHESKMSVWHKGRNIEVVIHGGWMFGDKPTMERWMVETFQVWPHPDSPNIKEDELYLQRKLDMYAQLCGVGTMKGKTEVETA